MVLIMVNMMMVVLMMVVVMMIGDDTGGHRGQWVGVRAWEARGSGRHLWPAVGHATTSLLPPGAQSPAPGST